MPAFLCGEWSFTTSTIASFAMIQTQEETLRLPLKHFESKHFSASDATQPNTSICRNCKTCDEISQYVLITFIGIL